MTELRGQHCITQSLPFPALLYGNNFTQRSSAIVSSFTWIFCSEMFRRQRTGSSIGFSYCNPLGTDSSALCHSCSEGSQHHSVGLVAQLGICLVKHLSRQEGYAESSVLLLAISFFAFKYPLLLLLLLLFYISYVRSIDHNFLGFQVKLVFPINLLPTNNAINSTHSESKAINMP